MFTSISNLYRHTKTKDVYIVLHIGKMQTHSWTWNTYGDEVDMEEVVIYQKIGSSNVWVRPLEEFEDGRFEHLTNL
jgi:hypothetical protein